MCIAAIHLDLFSSSRRENDILKLFTSRSVLASNGSPYQPYRPFAIFTNYIAFAKNTIPRGSLMTKRSMH